MAPLVEEEELVEEAEPLSREQLSPELQAALALAEESEYPLSPGTLEKVRESIGFIPRRWETLTEVLLKHNPPLLRDILDEVLGHAKQHAQAWRPPPAKELPTRFKPLPLLNLSEMESELERLQLRAQPSEEDRARLEQVRANYANVMEDVEAMRETLRLRTLHPVREMRVDLDEFLAELEKRARGDQEKFMEAEKLFGEMKERRVPVPLFEGPATPKEYQEVGCQDRLKHVLTLLKLSDLLGNIALYKERLPPKTAEAERAEIEFRGNFQTLMKGMEPLDSWARFPVELTREAVDTAKKMAIAGIRPDSKPQEKAKDFSISGAALEFLAMSTLEGCLCEQSGPSEQFFDCAKDNRHLARVARNIGDLGYACVYDNTKLQPIVEDLKEVLRARALLGQVRGPFVEGFNTALDRVAYGCRPKVETVEPTDNRVVMAARTRGVTGAIPDEMRMALRELLTTEVFKRNKADIAKGFRELENLLMDEVKFLWKECRCPQEM